MSITHNLTLDVHKRTSRIPPEVVVRQGESGTETIVASITKDGGAYTSGLSSVRLDILHADGTWARVAGTKSGSTVTVTLPSAALSSHGLCKLAHLVFFNTSDTNVETTEGFLLRILQAVDASNADEQAKDYDDLLTKLWRKWDAYEQAAEKQEFARARAESGRVSAEQERVTAEGGRVSAESARASAETERATADGKRSTAEAARADAEGSRATAEGKRASAEAARANAEAARASAETARIAAETKRETAQAKNNADQALNNEAMKKLSPVILTTGQYDATTHRPTITGEPNRTYFVPMKSADDNKYVEWMWIDSSWEKIGITVAEFSNVTTDQIDSVAGGASEQGDSVLSLTGLTYLWAKLKAAFAPLAHKHAASDVTSGTLSADRLPTVPVARGGTGATTAAGALTALGAASAADLAEVRDSVGNSAAGMVAARGAASSFTVTPKRDGSILVMGFCSSAWGYGGANLYLSVKCSGLSETFSKKGSLIGGDTVGREMTAIALYPGARAGRKYTCSASIDGASGIDLWVTAFAVCL